MDQGHHERRWHRREIADVVRELGPTRVSPTGAEAASALRASRPNNELPEGPPLRPDASFSPNSTLHDGGDYPTAVRRLRAAGATSRGHRHDCRAIVLLDALLSFTQEFRAERAMASVAPNRRGEGAAEDGRRSPPRGLVPSDVSFYWKRARPRPGRRPPRRGHSLRTDESTLTGESAPVEKSHDPPPDPDLPVGDQRNSLYLSTTVVHRRAGQRP